MKTFNVTLNGTQINTELEVINVNEIVGKHIHALTHGYGGQDYEADFIVGGVEPRYKFFNAQSQPENEEEAQALIEMYGHVIVDSEGNNTCIFCDPYCDGLFCCSDSDRATIFTIVEFESVEDYLDAAIHADGAMHESIIRSLGRFLGCEDSIELALTVRDMEHDYMAYPSDEDMSADFVENLVKEYAENIRKSYDLNASAVEETLTPTANISRCRVSGDYNLNIQYKWHGDKLSFAPVIKVTKELVPETIINEHNECEARKSTHKLGDWYVGFPEKEEKEGYMYYDFCKKYGKLNFEEL